MTTSISYVSINSSCTELERIQANNGKMVEVARLAILLRTQLIWWLAKSSHIEFASITTFKWFQFRRNEPQLFPYHWCVCWAGQDTQKHTHSMSLVCWMMRIWLNSARKPQFRLRIAVNHILGTALTAHIDIISSIFVFFIRPDTDEFYNKLQICQKWVNLAIHTLQFTLYFDMCSKSKRIWAFS